MSARLRLVLASGLVAALAGGLLFLRPQGLSTLGRDGKDLLALSGELGEALREEAELDSRRELLVRQVNAKSEAVTELLAGRLALLQAAARFRDLEEALPDSLAAPRRPPGGAADGERQCREVMTWVDNWLRVQAPEQAAGVAARLEEELRRHRGPDGTILLPR
jgi:hypothetical protein